MQKITIWTDLNSIRVGFVWVNTNIEESIWPNSLRRRRSTFLSSVLLFSLKICFYSKKHVWRSLNRFCLFWFEMSIQLSLDHPWRDLKRVVVGNRWSFYRVNFYWQSSKRDPEMIFIIGNLSVFRGGRKLRFDCTYYAQHC